MLQQQYTQRQIHAKEIEKMMKLAIRETSRNLTPESEKTSQSVFFQIVEVWTFALLNLQGVLIHVYDSFQLFLEEPV